MIRWRWLVLVGLLLWASPADAQTSGGPFAGYVYRCPVTICTGIRYNIKVPSFLAGNTYPVNAAIPWVGINDTSPGNCSGVNPCLAQMGLQLNNIVAGVPSWNSFVEQFPVGPATISTPTISTGDVVLYQILCTTNCTRGAVGMVFTMTITNQTTGSTNTFTENWRENLEEAEIIGETEGGTTHNTSAGTVQMSNVQVFQGGVWIPLPMPPAANQWGVVSGASQIVSMRAPTGANQDAVNSCNITGTTTYSPCEFSGYGPAPGMGL